MMEIALVSVAFCGTLILGGVLRELMRRPWHAELRELARQDVNRNRFGEIRTRLMMLVVEGTVDPRTPYFDALYRPLTLLMRAPDQHEQAAAVLLEHPICQCYYDGDFPGYTWGVYLEDGLRPGLTFGCRTCGAELKIPNKSFRACIVVNNVDEERKNYNKAETKQEREEDIKFIPKVLEFPGREEDASE